MCRQATIKTKPVRRVQSDMFTNQGVKAISTFYHPTTQKVFVRVETVTITLTESSVRKMKTSSLPIVDKTL